MRSGSSTCTARRRLAGLHELPGTLAHRSIPISMKPPLPSDVYEDFDQRRRSPTRRICAATSKRGPTSPRRSYAARAEAPKLPELDARGNEIWRLLFRIADQAGGDWPERPEPPRASYRAPIAARGASTGVKLLSHIRDVFPEERMFCGALVTP